MNDTLFRSSSLSMRRFCPDDDVFIFELLNTPTWKQFIGDRSIHTHNDAANYIINGPQALYRQYGYGPWRVSLNSTDEPIGMCGLFKRDYLDKPDLGFAFLPGFEGRGFAFEACMACLSYVKRTFEVDELYATTTDENLRSQRLLERCGFVTNGLVAPQGQDTFLLYKLTLQ